MRAKNVCLVVEDGLLLNVRSAVTTVQTPIGLTYVVRQLRNDRNALGADCVTGQNLLAPEPTSFIATLLLFDIVVIAYRRDSPMSADELLTMTKRGVRLCLHEMGERRVSYDELLSVSLTRVEQLS